MAEPTDPAPGRIPLAGNVISLALSLITISVLAICLSKATLLYGMHYTNPRLSSKNTSNTYMEKSTVY